LFGFLVTNILIGGNEWILAGTLWAAQFGVVVRVDLIRLEMFGMEPIFAHETLVHFGAIQRIVLGRRIGLFTLAVLSFEVVPVTVFAIGGRLFLESGEISELIRILTSNSVHLPLNLELPQSQQKRRLVYN
jgi:hypothetical protein